VEDLQMAGKSSNWNGCKFVSATIVHLTSDAEDTGDRMIGLKHTSHSLGGLIPPDNKQLKKLRRVRIFEDAIEASVRKIQLNGPATVITAKLSDIDIVRNPSTGMQTRPGTFAHLLSLTVSPIGVYVYQGYGPRGYTLKQYMQKHSVPLTFEQAKEFGRKMTKFLMANVDAEGRWTLQSNQLYKELFEVDLNALNCMSKGAQFDAYMVVETAVLLAPTVAKNFDVNLPKIRENIKMKCADEEIANGECVPGRVGKPNGVVPRRYSPSFVDYPKSSSLVDSSFQAKVLAASDLEDL